MNADDEAARIAHIRRWVRPDWERFMRPDWERYVHPAGHEAVRQEIALYRKAFETPAMRRERLREETIERERLRAEQAELDAECAWQAKCAEHKHRADLAWDRFMAVLRQYLNQKAGFNPDQPRVPAGNSDGGQWTDAGSGAIGSWIDDQRVISDATPDNDWEPGAQYAAAGGRAKGHHYVTRELFERLQKEGLSVEALRVFENYTTGPLLDPRSNKNDSEHRLYNKAVNELWDQFKGKNKIEVSRMTANRAVAFVHEVVDSPDPRIRVFLRTMMLREFLRRGLRGPRGNE